MGRMGDDAHGLVGRGHELAQLDAALNDALAGRGGLVVVTGEPGIGKTALARAFVEHAAARGASWAWGTCWDGGGAPPTGRGCRSRARSPAARTPPRCAPALGDGAPWIARLLPELAGTLGPPAAPSDLNADQARFRLFDALAACSRPSPSGARSSSCSTTCTGPTRRRCSRCEFVARALPDLPVLAIAAYRHSEAHARDELAAPLGGLARAARRLPLEGLDRDDVGRLAAAARAACRPASRRASRRGSSTAVHHASAGNPFFVDELVQLLASQGRLHDERAAQRRCRCPTACATRSAAGSPRSTTPRCADAAAPPR